MGFPAAPRAVITGAGSGLGRALSVALAQREARLLLSDIDESSLAETSALIEGSGAQVHTLKADVARLPDVEALRSKAQEAFGGVDVVVNNAGVAVAGPVGDVPIEDWHWQIDINLWGVIYGCHVFLPEMKQRGFGLRAERGFGRGPALPAGGRAL